jgi:hypothetical protein
MFALLLITGGASGVAVLVLSVLSLLRQQEQLHPILRQRIKNSIPAFVFFALLGFVFFGWTIWKGVDLWRGASEGYRWGKILFAAQIIKINIPGFSYEFFTGLRLNWMFGLVKKRFSFDLGYSTEIYFASATQNFEFGINIVAVAVTLYLLSFSSIS